MAKTARKELRISKKRDQGHEISPRNKRGIALYSEILLVLYCFFQFREKRGEAGKSYFRLLLAKFFNL